MSFIIHIGLPKSGSTYLQQIFKNQLINNIYLGKNLERGKGLFVNYDDPNLKNIIKYCTDDTIFEEENFSKIKLNFDDSKNFLISDGKFLNKTVSDIGQCLNKLKNILKPKIIIVLRNQVDFIYSAYRNNNFTFYGSKFKIKASLEDILEVSLDENMPSHHFFRFLKFNSFIEKVYKIFSKKNVKILFYEDLLNNKNDFFIELNSFLNENLKSEPLKKNKTTLINKILNYKRKKICTKIFNFYYKENLLLNEQIKVPKIYLNNTHCN